MKTYMPLNGLRWSRNSGSANCDMPQSVVFGRPGGAGFYCYFCQTRLRIVATHDIQRQLVSKRRRPCVDIKNIKRNLHAPRLQIKRNIE